MSSDIVDVTQKLSPLIATTFDEALNLAKVFKNVRYDTQLLAIQLSNLKCVVNVLEDHLKVDANIARGFIKAIRRTVVLTEQVRGLLAVCSVANKPSDLTSPRRSVSQIDKIHLFTERLWTENVVLQLCVSCCQMLSLKYLWEHNAECLAGERLPSPHSLRLNKLLGIPRESRFDQRLLEDLYKEEGEAVKGAVEVLHRGNSSLLAEAREWMDERTGLRDDRYIALFEGQEDFECPPPSYLSLVEDGTIEDRSRS